MRVGATCRVSSEWDPQIIFKALTGPALYNLGMPKLDPAMHGEPKIEVDGGCFTQLDREVEEIESTDEDIRTWTSTWLDNHSENCE